MPFVSRCRASGGRCAGAVRIVAFLTERALIDDLDAPGPGGGGGWRRRRRPHVRVGACAHPSVSPEAGPAPRRAFPRVRPTHPAQREAPAPFLPSAGRLWPCSLVPPRSVSSQEPIQIPITKPFGSPPLLSVTLWPLPRTPCSVRRRGFRSPLCPCPAPMLAHGPVQSPSLVSSPRAAMIQPCHRIESSWADGPLCRGLKWSTARGTRSRRTS